ncbi:substrate-binding domain-containing protein [Actinomyces sp. B33]|nr:substrate-binding domain-containing protein [Actinomyces sp. B33]
MSRALNHPDLLDPGTLERVRTVIDEVGYQPSAVARRLATRRSGLIGVLDTGSSVLGQILLNTGIVTAAADAGLSVRMIVCDWEGGESLDSALRSFWAEQLEGVIVMANTTLAVRVASLVAARMPVVLVSGKEIGDAHVSRVLIDQAGGTAALLDLIERSGYSRIGHIAGPAGWVDADVRRQVWESLPHCDSALLYQGDWSPSSGYEGAAILVERGVDAIFAANDHMALGALHFLADNAVQVPEEVGVVGFDDVLGSAHYQPPLTTVSQPFENLGRRCVKLLAELIAGGAPSTEILETNLIVRDSLRHL